MIIIGIYITIYAIIVAESCSKYFELINENSPPNYIPQSYTGIGSFGSSSTPLIMFNTIRISNNLRGIELSLLCKSVCIFYIDNVRIENI